MKKFLSLLLVLVFTLTIAPSAMAATAKKVPVKKPVETTVKKPVETTVTKTGQIKGVTETTLVVGEAGKNVSYKVSPSVEVYQLGNEFPLLEAAKKGLNATYKVLYRDNVPVHVTYMDIEAPGLEGEGYLGVAFNSVLTNLSQRLSGKAAPFSITLNYVRDNVTDSSLAPASGVAAFNATTVLPNINAVEVVELDPQEDDAYQFASSKKLNIGDVNIIPGSMVVKVNGKQLKVLEGAKEFDSAVVGDEVKLTLTKTMYALEFESEIGATLADVEKVVALSYKTKNYLVRTSELSTYDVSSNIYCELNGKETTLANALNRGNYAFVTTNNMGEIIYLNAFYQNLEAEVTRIAGDQITIVGYKGDKAAFTETLTLSENVAIQNLSGTELTVKQIPGKEKLKITVDPEDGYKVILIERQVK